MLENRASLDDQDGLDHQHAEPDREPNSGKDLSQFRIRKRDQKFWIALGLFGILAVVIWFTFGEGTVLVLGRQIQLRLIPLFVIGTFVFRTVMAREADKIRHGSGR